MDTNCNKIIKSQNKIAVFAGTSEGHNLAHALKKINMLDNADFFVATEYGRTTYEDLPEINLYVGRMDKEAMVTHFVNKGYVAVVDSTHPYAEVVTKYLREACEEAKIKYLRFFREEVDYNKRLVNFANSQEHAASLLEETEDKFLLTTGAKEIGAYKNVHNLGERGVARVLPTADSLKSCLDAGFLQKHIIGMQGPFTHEMNIATMKQFGCKTLVTKSTGKAGGFREKVALSEEGYNVIVIGRPEPETWAEGQDINGILERLREIWKL